MNALIQTIEIPPYSLTSPADAVGAAACPVPVSVAHGDGIGPEIMGACLDILAAAGANVAVETIEIGEAACRRGHGAGISPEAWESLRRTKVLLKAPITTPQGSGLKSLNVTLRKSLGLFANVRPCVAYHPFVATRHPGMDLVIVRENEEDLYAGIEHRQTDEVYQCLKLITRPGCERIVRYAFEYAVANGRSKVSCFTKDNIMKLTDGLFHKVFDEIGAEYPRIEKEHMIVDIGAARLADTPRAFDVIVTPNLYGDVLSDVAAQIAGSVGLAGSANVGEHAAMFEAIHGSAPQLAGSDRANPSGLLMAAVMMLRHIGQPAVAAKIQNAWLRTIEDGIHTPDIYNAGFSTDRVGTKRFARAIVERLGEEPEELAAVSASAISSPIVVPAYRRKAPAKRRLVGIDVFVNWTGSEPDILAHSVSPPAESGFCLEMISNRGVKVWPEGHAETFRTDHWRCRFMLEGGIEGNPAMVAHFLTMLARAGIDFIKTEHLYSFDGQPGFSKGQGQ